MKHRMKQVISWLLSLALVLSLLPSLGIVALAAGETPIMMLSGTLMKGGSEWKLNQGFYVLSSGSYKLESDISIGTMLISGTATLDLNGYGINLTPNTNPVYVNNNSTLTLKDSGTRTHYYTMDDSGLATVGDSGTAFTGGYITGGMLSTGGCVIIASDSSSFFMEGGTLLGNRANDGGAVYMNGGTFTMTGGAILGNVAARTGGGAVYVGNGGTFTLSGNASINNNASASAGGGVFVYNNGTFNMDGGEITGNAASNLGGGVFAQSGAKVNMTGGSINENTASKGGGVLINSNCTLDMSGGTISKNVATSDSGGGVYLDSQSALAMSGSAKISENRSNKEGGGVYAQNASPVTLKDSAEISDNQSGANGGGMCVVSSTVTLDGGAKISGNTAGANAGGIYSANCTITMKSTYTGSISNNTAQSNSGGGVAMTGENDVLEMKGGSISNNHAKEYAGGLLVVSGTVTMEGGSISNNDATEEGGGVSVYGGTMAMKGGSISQNTTPSHGGGVYVDRPATFNMTGGSISENTVTGEDKYGGGVLNLGTFTMTDGCTIEKNSAGRGGGGLFTADATLSGGTISQNTSAYGGGLYVADECTLTMNGGTVTSNEATENGGGMYADGTFEAKGVTITSNEAGNKGGGVYIRTALNVGGGVNITSNTANGETDNVYVPENKTIGITSALTGDAAIGVRMQTIGVFTSGLSGKLPNGKEAADLFSDDSGINTVQQDETSGEAMLVPPHVHHFTYTADGDTITATCDLAGCTLDDGEGNPTATLTIAAPTSGNDATVTVSPEGAITGYTIKYQSKSGTAWGDETTTAPSAAGIHRANVTLGSATATVSYGNNCITYATELENGSISGETGATCGATITPVITPDTGYELDTLTVTPEDGSGVASVELTEDGTGFIMPEANVNVSATFKKTVYNVTIAEGIANGTVTADKTTASYQDEVTLTVTPAAGYALGSITTTSGTLAQTAVDSETGVMTYVLTMDAGDAEISAEFSQLTVFTIFYNASGSPESVSIKATGGEDSHAMSNSARLGNIDCWAIQVTGGESAQTLSYEIKAGNSDWTLLDIPVVDNIPNTLAEGSAVAIKGEVNVFAVAFSWGEDPDTDSLYYLATPNTTSLEVPNPEDTDSEVFRGWTYLIPSDTEGEEAEEVTVDKTDSGDTMTVSLDRITKNTIVKAIWMPKDHKFTVSFDPDNGGAVQTAYVTYQDTASQPEAPTKAGYEFGGWVLADTAVEMADDTLVQLSAGTAFDFDTKIINNLSLRAKWKHVHAYVCLQLDDSALGGKFASYSSYKGQLHVRICSDMDDYSIEGHSFANGKCVCGASILDEKVTLTKYVGDGKTVSSVIKDSLTTVTAPEKQGNKIFSRWQYSTDTTDGQNGTWTDLSTMRCVSFFVPSNVSVRAVYDNDRFKLYINSSKYSDKQIAFQFNYYIPDGFTVEDGGLMLGDNVRMRFWDCTVNLWFLGHQYEPSMRNAVKVFGASTIAKKMYNYETINEPGSAKPILKPLKTFGKTGTLALAYEPYTLASYKNAIGAKNYEIDNYDQEKYPTYAMGYIVCKDNSTGGYAIFMTDAISATLENPTSSDVTTVAVS